MPDDKPEGNAPNTATSPDSADSTSGKTAARTQTSPELAAAQAPAVKVAYRQVAK